MQNFPPRLLTITCRLTEATRTRLERMMQRDGITRAELIDRALFAYEVMYPGPDYRPPEIRPK